MHTAKSQGGRLSYTFTKITDIAETFTILKLRISQFGYHLVMKRNYIVLGLDITVRM